jgi:hypothetical protein
MMMILCEINQSFTISEFIEYKDHGKSASRLTRITVISSRERQTFRHTAAA